MKLSKVALLALRGMDKNSKAALAEKMGLTEDTLYRWLRNNDDNFTKAAHLATLKEELGLKEEDLLDMEVAA